MNPFLDIHPDVAEAVRQKRPVVALESTIISHGMPYPQNVETALKVEQTIRENGAVPATVARSNISAKKAGPSQRLRGGIWLCLPRAARTGPPP